MPKMKIVTDEMLDRAGRIGQSIDSLSESQKAVSSIFQNMGRDFSGKVPTLMIQYILDMDEEYRSMNALLTSYKTFMEDTANNYEWTEEQLTKWAVALNPSSH